MGIGRPTGSPGSPGAGLLLVLATALVSGVSTFVNVYAVRGTNSDAFVTVRNAAVALAIVPLAVLGWRGGHQRWRARDAGRLAVIGLVGGAVPFLLFFHGLTLVGRGDALATASFVYRTLFLIATVLAVAFLRERLHGRVLVAAVLLLAGNFLLLSLTAPVWTLGAAYVLAATLLWAVEYTISKRVLRDLPSGTVALGRMGFGAGFLVAYLLATGQLGVVGTLSGAQWEWVAISAALLAAFVGTWYAGLRRVDLGVATAVLVLGFPVTWALAVGVGGSPFTLAQALGAAVIAVGVAVAVGLGLLRETRRWVARSVRLGRPTT